MTRVKYFTSIGWIRKNNMEEKLLAARIEKKTLIRFKKDVKRKGLIQSKVVQRLIEGWMRGEFVV